MTQLAFDYKPRTQTTDAPVVETIVERRRVDNTFGRWVEECKRLRGAGWDVTVLLTPDEKMSVLLACRPSWRGKGCP